MKLWPFCLLHLEVILLLPNSAAVCCMCMALSAQD